MDSSSQNKISSNILETVLQNQINPCNWNEISQGNLAIKFWWLKHIHESNVTWLCKRSIYDG